MIPLLMITLFSCSASVQNASQTEEQLDTLRAHIKKTMEETKVPGLGVVIIKDGKVILAEGFGTRDTNTGLPLDSQSIFLIGSGDVPPDVEFGVAAAPWPA